MEDDDDNDSVISEHKSGETNAVASKVAILKSSKDSGSSSRRDRRRNRRYGYQSLCTVHRKLALIHWLMKICVKIIFFKLQQGQRWQQQACRCSKECEQRFVAESWFKWKGKR